MNEICFVLENGRITNDMEIVTLKKEHLWEAGQLAHENYQEELSKVGALPEVKRFPDLSWFTENALGVAALAGSRLLGFIACCNPWDGAFDSNARGTFTPVHAHGCVRENRARIYERMYQSMADKLVKQGVLYHGIALYAHDVEAITAYFHNGFGQRCSDAMRRMELIPGITPTEGIVFEELPAGEARQVRKLRRQLKNHMGESCCFMCTSEEEFEVWVQKRENNGNRIFVAKEKKEGVEGEQLPFAFLEICDEAETFVTELTTVKNICGAFCMPEYRGRQIYQNLINYAVEVLKTEGYQYLGVDYESFNPTAQHFWPKYFEPYTCSVVRRIDECAGKKYEK